MKRLFATDLDGTILPHEGSFNRIDIEALVNLGEKGIVRVIATGRSLLFALRALNEDFPIDYLVFSSGAGVYDWKKKKIIRSLHLNRTQVSYLQTFFSGRGLGYTLHRDIPDNHCFWYEHVSNSHPDLSRFVQNRIDYATPIAELGASENDFCQMLTIIDEPFQAEQILNELKGVKTIRATSPIDGKSIWIEVFHHEASKASGIALICEIEKIVSHNVWVLGNDYNDIDMLNAYFPNSFVVENAPFDLKQKYQVVPAVSEGGMARLANEIML